MSIADEHNFGKNNKGLKGFVTKRLFGKKKMKKSKKVAKGEDPDTTALRQFGHD